MGRSSTSGAALLVLLALAGPVPGAHAQADCDGPAPDAEPNTPAWTQREADNVECGNQRSRDTESNPAYAAAAAQVQAEHGGPVPEDPFRDPERLAGKRFRFERVTFPNTDGEQREGMLFRPCDRSCDGPPAGLRTWAPPYPAVVIVHGGAASQEMYLWAAEALAESGYMVLTFQVPNPENAGGGGHYPDAKAALEFLLSTSNPHWAELDRERIGLAGHSAGGVAVSRLGQEDPRIGAIVSWDRAQSSPMPADLRLRTPALFVTADFNCQRVPVCLPEAYPSPPDPHGPGNKDEDFQRVAAAGLDTMKISLRAATHLDFTEFAPTPPSSRYGAIVTSYYTLAWFDRYLRGASAARLTAERFDDSADVHYISGGTFDPATGENVPARIAGRPVRDRLSFHFRSAWSFARGSVRCDDIRAGCAPVADAGRPPARPCRRPRFTPRAARVRRGRVRLRPRIVCDKRVRSAVVELRATRRLVRAITGRPVTLRVARKRRNAAVTFTVDGTRHRVKVRLRRR